MPRTKRYSPELAPGEACVIGMNFDMLLPPSAVIVSALFKITTNTTPPTDAPEFAVGPVAIEGRAVYTTISGGISGTDYQLTWTVTDSDGHVFPRTAFLLCAPTS